ncbi:hypothetical protein [Flavobacterium sp.]|uniref:hypothetical protein n=1 Tax=Flavobacterium sp. TaxID=239 RepID=UPI004034DD3C
MQSTTSEKLLVYAPYPAIGFLALTAILLLVSPAFAGLVLKEGRTAKDIRPFLLFILFIALFMLSVFAIVGAAQ